MLASWIKDGLIKNGLARRTAAAVGVAGILALSGTAFGNDHSRNGMNRGGGGGGSDRGSARGHDNHRSRGGSGGHCDSDRTRVSFGVGVSNYGSAFSLSVGSGYRSSCAPRPVYVAPCPPRPIYVDDCRPTYYPPVINRCDDWSYPRRSVYINAPIVVSRPPVVIERPVYVDRPVVYEQRSVQVVEKPVYIEKPVYVSVQSPQTAEPQAGRYQDRELGDAYLRMGDAANAARAYQRYLSAWAGDGTAMRNMGFALIAKGDVQDGFRAVVQGYKLESGLLKRGLRIEDLGGEVGFSRLMDAAARGASGTNTAEGWLTVAILQHAAGRRDSAVNALQRSRDAGLEQGLLDQFTLEISKPTN